MSKRCIGFIVFLVGTLSAIILSCSTGKQAEKPRLLADSSFENLKLWYDEPAIQWVEALPIGNGRLGGMVFCRPDSERIQLNDDTLWDGGPIDHNNPEALEALPVVRKMLFEGKNEEAEKLAFQKMMGVPRHVKSYQSLADLRIIFPQGREITDYRRELDLDTGIVSASYSADGIQYTEEVFSSAADQVVMIRLTSATPGKLDCTIGMDRQQDSKTTVEGGNKLVLKGRCGDEGMRFQATAEIAAENGQLNPANDTITVSGADEITITVAGATSYTNRASFSADPAARCNEVLDTLRGKAFDTLRSNHIADHRSMFRRLGFTLNSNDPKASIPTNDRLKAVQDGADDAHLAELYFQYGRYLLMGCSRPGCLPANLQGLWNEHMKAPWHSDFHTNINLQMNYWPAEVGNLAECHMPLFDLMDSLVEPGNETARRHYGANGWVVHHLTDVWGFATPADGVCGIWPMGAAWLCQHPYEHYLYSGDKKFLKERAWPLMKGAAEFILDFLVEAPEGTPVAGKLVTNPSHSPENSFFKADGSKSMFTYAATMDIMIIQDLFTNCINTIDTLDLQCSQELKEDLQKALDNLAPLQISPRTGCLQEWVEDYEEPEPGHRHMSHFYGFHPGCQINFRDTPEMANAIKNSLNRRLDNGGGGTGWSRAWVVNFQARFGEGDAAYHHLKHLFQKCTSPNLFDQHPPFQIDGNFGATAGIMEMLMQSHAGEIVLLPALPPVWHDGCIAGMRARGGYEVDIEWSGGKLARAILVAKNSGPVTVRYGEKTVTIDTLKGNHYVLDSTLTLSE